MTIATPPIIGINAGVREIEGPGKWFITVRTTYIDAVREAGGIPIVLPAVEDADLVDYHADLCDGFIFTGGPDLDPSIYGQEVHETVKNQLVAKRREMYDMSLVHQVIDRKKPFLAICLGCQEVNVAMGGTLIQDIPSSIKTDLDHAKQYERHDIEVQPDTLIASLVGAGKILGNTSHHQAVDKPGKGLKVTSHSPTDGIIESLELQDYPFGIAVQWHPEMIYSEPTHLALFQGLVKAAAANK
jgi:putative glutamine amidotransferase